jgi:hypothetical protein
LLRFRLSQRQGLVSCINGVSNCAFIHPCIHRAFAINILTLCYCRVGQAAILRSWEYEDGRKGGLAALAQAEAEAAAAAAGVAPSPEDLKAAEADVAEQAGMVRELKESRGLSNADEEVKAAVDELLQRKARLDALTAAAAAAAAHGNH